MEKTNRTSSEIARQARRNAMTMKGRSKVYRRIESWDEVGVGTKDEKYIVTLVPGWSFDENALLRVSEFKSLASAMRGVSLTYPYKMATVPSELELTPEVTITTEPIVPIPAVEPAVLTIEEKLKALCAIQK